MTGRLGLDFEKTGKRVSAPDSTEDSRDKPRVKPMSRKGPAETEAAADRGKRVTAAKSGRNKVVVPAKAQAEPLKHAQLSNSASAGNPVPRRKPPFEHTHRRVTTYLEVETHERLKKLHDSGQVGRLSHLVNAAVKSYIDRFYPTVE